MPKEPKEIRLLKGFIANEFIDSKIVNILSDNDDMDYDKLTNKRKGLLISLLVEKSKLILRQQA